MDKQELQLTYGADPELFITSNDDVIGSERVLPPRGINNNTIIRDGFQVEFNPKPSDTPESLVKSVAQCFFELNKHIKKSDIEDVKISLDRVVTITQKEMDSMSAESKVFGCKPSYNIYGKSPEVPTDASDIMYRSGGGHIHLGGRNEATNKMVQDYSSIIPTLDIVVGILMVLIDPSPENNRRRAYYGRAGEFRMPSYGVEYRTPSNIWLKHPDVAKLVVGTLVTTACKIVFNSEHSSLLSAINSDDVCTAINTSNVNMAKNISEIAYGYMEKYLSEDERKIILDLINGKRMWIGQRTMQDDIESLEAWFDYNNK